MNNIKKEEFDLLWGIAPPDSIKGEKGKQIKQFYRAKLQRAHQQGADAAVDYIEKRLAELIFRGNFDYKDTDKILQQARNARKDEE